MHRRRFLQALGGATAVGAAGTGKAKAWWWDSGTSSPEVTTESGRVEGTNVGSTDVYKGIPYAKQPVGDRRWRPPETPAPDWDGTLDATEYAPIAPQPNLITSAAGSLLGIDFTVVAGREDGCLNLNVWAPQNADPGEKPVMVWIHGGGYEIGSNRYNSQQLSQRGDVVVVTVNYRLGPLGFYTHPELLDEDPRNVNQGYQDMIAALEWVQRNIREFGGDPNNVTIFGESAGGNAVLTLMTDPDTEGLFHRVICESGPVIEDYDNREEAAEEGVEVAESLGCTGADALECLRDASLQNLLSGQRGLIGSIAGGDSAGLLEGALAIVVDGTVIEEHPALRFRDGEFHDVPLITGGNNDETQLFLALQDVPDRQAYRDTLESTLTPGQADRVLEAYPAENYGSPKDALIDATTDGVFLCNDRLTAKWISDNGGTVYRYIFDDSPSDPFELIQLIIPDRGAYHAAELAYVFGDGDNITQQGFEISDTGLRDKWLSRTMQDYWTNHAWNGNPNDSGWFGPPDWPRFDSTNQRQVRLKEDAVEQESGPKPGCGVWEPILKDRIGL